MNIENKDHQLFQKKKISLKNRLNLNNVLKKDSFNDFVKIKRKLKREIRDLKNEKNKV